jgi:hypothetical protein
MAVACAERSSEPTLPLQPGATIAAGNTVGTDVSAFFATVHVRVARPESPVATLRAFHDAGSFEIAATRNSDGSWRTEFTRALESGMRLTTVIPGDGQPALVRDQFGNQQSLDAIVAKAPGAVPIPRGAFLGPDWIDSWVLTPTSIVRQRVRTEQRLGPASHNAAGIDVFRRAFQQQAAIAEEHYESSTGLPVKKLLTWNGTTVSEMQYSWKEIGTGTYHRAATLMQSFVNGRVRATTEHRLSNVRVITGQ